MNGPPPAHPHRPGDDGYNDPSLPPDTVRPLTPQEAALFDAEEPWQPEPAAAGETVASAGTVINRTRRFFRTATAALLLAVLVLLLFLYAAVLDFLARAAAYPPALQAPVWILLALVLVLAVFAVARLFGIWRALGRHAQVTLEQAGLDDQEAAQQTLTRYLRQLHGQTGRAAGRWDRLFAHDHDQAARVRRACARLTGKQPVDAVAWLESFQRDVLKPLDTAAEARIRRYWKLVGIKTAISPFPLVDAIAVFYNNFLLIGDLAALYGRRISRHEALILLGWIVFQVYVATQAQELLESAAEEMTQTIQSGLARSVTRLISPKIAEGTIHALVTWRIGRRAQRLMRPVTVA